MASPIKAGSASHRTTIDTYIKEYTPDPELQGAMNECRHMFDVKVRAIKAVEADRMLPKYDRLGMARIAWLFDVTKRTLYGWWGAYKKDGIGALRSYPGNRGRPQKVDIGGGPRRVRTIGRGGVKSPGGAGEAKKP